MATIAALTLTLADWAKRNGTNDKTSVIVEILNETNEILTDMRFKEGNLATGEQATIRTGLPTAFYRMINQGTPTSKSKTAQITENAAMLVARSQVDKELANLNGDLNAFRLSESAPFMEAMNQTMATTLFYGTGANPAEFVGFAPRYNDLSAENAGNILDAGGTGSDNASMWLIAWGDQTIHGIFPKGTKAGLDHEDLGIDDVLDGDGNEFRAYKDLYTWKNGLMVKDWRYAVRIANIDVSELVAQASSQAPTASTALVKMMSRAIDRLPSTRNVSMSFYANRTLISLLRVAAMDKSNNTLNITESTNQFGDTIFTTRFFGHPVRIVDVLTETEARVV